MLALKIYMSSKMPLIASEPSIERQIEVFLLMRHDPGGLGEGGPAVLPQDYYGTHVCTQVSRCVVVPIPLQFYGVYWQWQWLSTITQA